MANIVVTKTAGSIEVDFGVYAGTNNLPLKRSYWVDSITQIELHSDHVSVYVHDTNEYWKLTFDGTYSGQDFFIVDTVAGAAATSQADLFSKISALR